MPGSIYYGHLMLTPIFWSFFGIFGAFDVLLPASAASQSSSRWPPRGGGGGVRFNRGGVLMLRFWCQDGPGVSIIHTKSQPSRHISVSFQSFKMSKHSSHCLSAVPRKHIAEELWNRSKTQIGCKCVKPNCGCCIGWMGIYLVCCQHHLKLKTFHGINFLAKYL